jgi:hypothetical protein
LIPLKAKNEEARAHLGLAHLYRAAFHEQRAKTALDKTHAIDPKDPEINGDWQETRPAAEKIRLLRDFEMKLNFRDGLVSFHSGK